MTELEPALRELRSTCREVAVDLRSRALAVDARPLEMAAHLDSETLTSLRTASTPRRFRDCDDSLFGASYTGSCLARVVANAELACGDAGILSENNGASLAGLAVDALGSDDQQERFYRAIADGRTWTFFAMTEEARGSDASAMQTRLDKDPGGGWRLNGAKRYVANAVRGGIGVVFARTGPSALTIRAALVQLPAAGFDAHLLDMIGLRGACISGLAFDGVRILPDELLGSHLPASRRGMWGAGRVFNVMRAQIAAQALGVGFAAWGYVREQRPGWSGLDLMSARLAAARALLYDVAATIDGSPGDRRSPSIAKLHVTDLAVQATRWAEYALGPGSLAEHPLLEKWCRDVFAFEFMDGTSNILRLNIAPVPARQGLAS